LTFNIDIQTRLSEGKHVFPEDLAQIRSAVPEIFEAQTNKQKVTDIAKTEPYLRVVINLALRISFVGCVSEFRHVVKSGNNDCYFVLDNRVGKKCLL